MAETKKPDPKPAPELSRASESGDPEVHALLANRSALEQWNRQQEDEILRMQAELGVRRTAIAELNKQLADLGYC